MSVPQREREEEMKGFIRRMNELDVGDRARLRRNAGRRLAEAPDVMGLFYRLAPHGISSRDEERYFTVATLFPLANSGPAGDLGDTLRRARSPKNGAGLDRRMEILLDADGEQLPFRLRRAISFAQSNRAPVNWRQLLEDVLLWDVPGKPIQRAWARSYFGNLS